MNVTATTENLSAEQLTLENTRLKTENTLLKKGLRGSNSGWTRLRDFIVGQSPEEMSRLANAANGSKGVEVLLRYITSLWSEIARLEQEAKK